MSESQRVISRAEYNRGRADRLTPEAIAGVGTCILRLLSETQIENAAATERVVFIIHVSAPDGGYTKVGYLSTSGGSDDQAFEVGADESVCDADGFVVAHSEVSDVVLDIEAGYFTGTGQQPRQELVALSAPTEVVERELTAA